MDIWSCLRKWEKKKNSAKCTLRRTSQYYALDTPLWTLTLIDLIFKGYLTFLNSLKILWQSLSQVHFIHKLCIVKAIIYVNVDILVSSERSSPPRYRGLNDAFYMTTTRHWLYGNNSMHKPVLRLSFQCAQSPLLPCSQMHPLRARQLEQTLPRHKRHPSHVVSYSTLLRSTKQDLRNCLQASKQSHASRNSDVRRYQSRKAIAHVPNFAFAFEYVLLYP